RARARRAPRPPCARRARAGARARERRAHAPSPRTAREPTPGAPARCRGCAARRARSPRAAPTPRASARARRSAFVPVAVAADEVAVRVDAPVAQEGPEPAHALDLREVAVDDEHLLLVGRRAREHAAERIGDEGLAPEADRALGPYAVHGDDEDAVRDRVGALRGLPRLVLGAVDLGALVQLPPHPPPV